MSDKKEMQELSSEELKDWLVSLGVSAKALGDAHVKTLLEVGGYTTQTSFYGISAEDLEEVNKLVRDGENQKLTPGLRAQLVYATAGLGKGEPKTEAEEPKTESNSEELEDFFTNTELSDLTFDGESFFIPIQLLSWTNKVLGACYWRSCYSYILCSTVAFFEDSHAEYVKNLKEKRDAYGRTLVLTGVQGTGKSVLGAIIALVMGKAFGWRVTYTWSDQEFTFGNANPGSKVIRLLDYSTGKSASAKEKFVFIVSSANKQRWADDKQQGSWTEKRGNYTYMDTVPVDEIVEIGKRAGKRQVQSEENYSVVGGVARLCILDTDEVTHEIQDALKNPELELVKAIQKVATLQDERVTPGSKFYPGLLVHLRPTNPFRNHATVVPCSQVVANEFSRIINKKDEDEISSLMTKLLRVSKARGFGGLIWEPLFTKKAKKKLGNLVIVGAELPAKSSTVKTLLKIDCKDIETVPYDSLEDLKTLLLNSVTSLSPGKVLMAKAQGDNFIAIDAVLLIVHADRLSLIGLQMTVAGKGHALKEQGVMDFVEAAAFLNKNTSGYTLSTEIWFLQPEECLDGFNFTCLQPLNLVKKAWGVEGTDADTDADTGEADGTSGKRERKRKRQKKSTNKRAAWDESVQKVSQCIAIASFTAADIDADTAQTKISKAIGALLEEELKKGKESTETTKSIAGGEPTLRRWLPTMKIAAQLAKNGIPGDLVEAIKSDLMTDQVDLERSGLIEKSYTFDEIEKELQRE